MCRLFSHAKAGEDGVEDLLGGYAAGDGGECFDAVAQGEGGYVEGGVCGERFVDASGGGECFGQGLALPDIGNHNVGGAVGDFFGIVFQLFVYGADAVVGDGIDGHDVNAVG